MALGMRHIVWFSATLSLGAFFYVLTLEPMDPAKTPRAAALDRTPSRSQLIGMIQRSLAHGQMSGADRIADTLLLNYPEDPSAMYYRAIVDRGLGRDEAALAMFGKLGNQLRVLSAWPRRYSAQELDYFRAWAQIGTGAIEDGQRRFSALADDLEARVTDKDGEVHNASAAYNLACYRAMAGDANTAIDWWRQAVELGYGQREHDDSSWWKADPDLESLSDRFDFWEIAMPLINRTPERADFQLRDRQRQPGQMEESTPDDGAEPIVSDDDPIGHGGG